nr:MAG TPA: hypothetical protein [Bacteriophage sp.]
MLYPTELRKIYLTVGLEPTTLNFSDSQSICVAVRI